MEAKKSTEPRKLFKHYLEQQIHIEDNRPLFFRRNMRWRVNSIEYAVPFSKKGLFRGYIKYGAFAYMAYYYTRYRLFAPSHGHGHDDHGHGHSDHGHNGSSAHGNGDHGDHGNSANKPHGNHE